MSENNKAAKETVAIATYGEWTPEQMEKESNEMKAGGDFWKAPVGNTSVRFLPPKISWQHSPFVIQHQHFIHLPGVDRAVIFCCPRMHAGSRCLACKKADQLEQSGNSRDEKAARNLRPQKRMFANVIVTPKDPNSKPVIWGFGTKVYRQLVAIRENDEGGGNFLDPHKGFNIIVKRVGTGKDDTEYTCTPARNLTPLANMDWIEIQVDCQKLIRIPTEEQQRRLLDGEDARDVWGDGKVDKAHGATRRKDDADDLDDDLDDGAIDAKSTEKKRTAEDDIFDEEVELD